MGNGNSQDISKYIFLVDKKTPIIFGKLDYLLRKGTHVQREYPLPGELFRFIEKYYESLEAYYKDIFNINLSTGGSEFDTYYFIDFDEGTRGNIPVDSRDYLETEFLIVGMLFLKFYKFDGNIDLERVSEFKNLLLTEYEEEKDALRKLIANASGEKSSDFSDEKIEKVIDKAFQKFTELGWIAREDDTDKDLFRYMPSFERLRSLYEPQISAIDEILNTDQDG